MFYTQIDQIDAVSETICSLPMIIAVKSGHVFTF